MNSPICQTCNSPLEKLFLKENPLKNYGYCTKCNEPSEYSSFYMRFGFEATQKQNGKDSLNLDGHQLIWKDIAGVEKYYCATCDSELLHSHHHHYNT